MAARLESPSGGYRLRTLDDSNDRAPECLRAIASTYATPDYFDFLWYCRLAANCENAVGSLQFSI